MIRVYKAGDAGALEKLLDQLGYRVPPAAIDKRVATIRTTAGEAFVKEMDAMVVGCVNAIVDARLAAGTHGEIATLVVLDGYRGRGIGKALVEHAEAWLAARVESIRIRANVIRDQAHQFYRRLGYRETKSQKVFLKKMESFGTHSSERNRE